MPRIVLKGYYGFGNLGDDLLLLVSCNWIKEVFPDCELLVCTASGLSAYLPSLVEYKIDGILPLHPEPEADLIINGGGGTFFDFSQGNLIYELLNQLVDTLGPAQLEHWRRKFRTLKGWPDNTNALRIALGIGVGEFTSGSRKYYQKAADLAGMQLIMTRDQVSLQRLGSYNIKSCLLKGTDLAFASQYWLTPRERVSGPKAGRIGFILRNWARNPDHLEAVHSTAVQLAVDGYHVSIFIFETHRDHTITERFREFQVFPWQPATSTLEAYLDVLGKQDLLITERAHGAIIAAALGMPSICLGIEPKLQTIHEMLADSSLYLDYPFTTDNLIKHVGMGFEIAGEQVTRDFETNRRLLLNRLSRVTIWLEAALNSRDPVGMFCTMISTHNGQ